MTKYKTLQHQSQSIMNTFVIMPYTENHYYFKFVLYSNMLGVCKRNTIVVSHTRSVVACLTIEVR